MGSAWGTMNPNATTASGAADPNQGLSAGQLFARKAVAGGLQGLGQGLQQQSGAGQPPVDFTQLGRQFNPALRRRQQQPGAQPAGPSDTPASSPFPSGQSPYSSFYG